jgi:hypothetical protein
VQDSLFTANGSNVGIVGSTTASTLGGAFYMELNSVELFINEPRS